MAKDLEHGRACYDRGAWHDAFEALRLADQAAPLDCDDLRRLGTAAYLLGQELEFERYFDRLYHVELEHGHPENAARAAFWLGLTSPVPGRDRALERLDRTRPAAHRATRLRRTGLPVATRHRADPAGGTRCDRPDTRRHGRADR